jgi:hypothetical protein
MAQEEVKPQEETEEMSEERAEEQREELEEERQQMELPPVNFENFVLGLYNTALIHLGIRDPETGELIRNLPLARHTIDTLGMIQEKTKGNLSAPEGNLLENLLYQLRMSYLRASRQAAEKPKEEAETEGEETEPQEESEAQEAADKDSC